jgi:hypothetical protein
MRIHRLWLLFVLLPVLARAQTVGSGNIAGVVRDASGGVLPGVTVEAASPALIEKARVVVTDDQGVFRIIDLRPGVYSITFTLAGFSTFRREGVELNAGFTASVNATLSVGALEETITVTGAAPVVDVQSIIQQRVISREERDAIPLPSNSGAYVAIIPGAVQAAANQDVGGNMGENRQQFTVHGSRTADFQQLRDGQFFGTMVAAGNFMSSVNPTTVQEVNVLTAGGLTAESETGGAQINLVPRDGGNLFNGSFRADFGHQDLQSNNLDAALQARGATTAPFIKQNYEIAGGIGGPIARDKLWYFGSARRWISQSYQPGNYFNKTQGTMFYTPDLDRPAYENNFYNEETLRLTWQAAEKHKITGMVSTEYNCNCYFGIQAGTLAPEATGDDLYWPNWRLQLSWSNPASNRLLFEGGGTIVDGLIVRRLTGGSYDDVSILDLNRNYRYNAAGGSISGFTQAWGPKASDFGQFNTRFNVSYVTGSHAFKTGVQYRRGYQILDLFISGNRSYTFRGTIPQSVTYWAGPYFSEVRQHTVASFAQDQWTIRRMTLNLGLRFDYLQGWVPDQRLPAGDFVPERHFDKVDSALNWKDVNPRLGVAYDVFGSGRTALKAYLGRYVTFQNTGGLLAGANPVSQMITGSTRTWTDNGDYIPQENELGPHSAADFGQVRLTTRYDDALTRGWQTREYSWQGSVSLQHELGRGLAVNLGYFRTWYGNFTVTDNLAVSPSDYDEYCITAPSDAKLPGGGGQRICGLYDLDPSKFGLVDNLVTTMDKFGKRTEVFNGVDVTMNWRLPNAGLIAGGVSFGQAVADECDVVVDSPQKMLRASVNAGPEVQGFCRDAAPWSAGTQVKLTALYPLPWDLRVSATYQDIASIPLAASHVVTSAAAAPSLGRNFSGGAAATRTIELIAPNSLFSEGRNRQINFRLTRRFRAGGTQVEPQLDVFNAFNSNQVLVMTTRYGAAWQNATGVLAPRLFKLGVQVNF